MNTRVFLTLVLATLLAVAGTNDLRSQSQTEEDLWDQIQGAPDYQSQADLVRLYRERYCDTNQNSRYCAQADRLWDRIGQFASYRQGKCDEFEDGIEKINCLKDLLVEFESGTVAIGAQDELARQEEKLWMAINGPDQIWEEEAFRQFLELFPTSQYMATAQQRLDFLQAEATMPPERFYDKHITGQGAAILEQFQVRAGDSQLASKAADEQKLLETSFWNQAQQDGEQEDYQRYLTWYPNGTYAPEAQIQVTRLAQTPRSRSSDRSTRAWELISSSQSPGPVRSYISRFPRGKNIADAEKLLARLDLTYWKQTPAGSGQIAFEEYLDSFPNGAFKSRADRASVSADDTEGWQQALAVHSIKGYQDYLANFPTGFYREDAQRGLSELRPTEFSVQVVEGWHVFHFYNSFQLELMPYSKDSLIIDDTDLARDNVLRIMIHASGSHVVKLLDQYQKPVTIRISKVLKLADFQESVDSIMVEVWGGSTPYEIKLQDTSILELEELYPQQFNQGWIRISKDAFRDIVDPGTYLVSLRDRSETTNIQQAGLITIRGDRKKTLIIGALVILALSIFSWVWMKVNKKVGGKKEIFDELGDDMDWGEEIT